MYDPKMGSIFDTGGQDKEILVCGVVDLIDIWSSLIARGLNVEEPAKYIRSFSLKSAGILIQLWTQDYTEYGYI